MSKSQIKLAIVAGAVVIVAFIAFLLKPFAVINAGDRGVVLTWGAFNGQVMQPGLNWLTPLAQSVVRVNVQTQKFEIEKSEAYSKDLQLVDIHSVLNYNIDTTNVGLLYQNVGLNIEEKVVRPNLEASVKQVVAKYTAEEILSQRAKVQDEITNSVISRLKAFNLDVTQYSMVNEQFSEQFEAAIERKQVAEQDAKAQENVTKQEEQKKQQKILQAQALAETSKLQADALASQNGDKVISLKNAEANLTAAQKWNGVLPLQMIPGSTVPFINVNQK